MDAAAGAVTAQGELDWMRDMTQEEFVLGDIAKLDQRWMGSWAQSLKSSLVSETPLEMPWAYAYFPFDSELRPVRIPLHSKQTKRCHKCRHVLIKPEQKSQSTRFKLKLMAGNYLPSIDALLIVPSATSTIQTPRSVTKAKTSTQGTAEDTAQGKTKTKTLHQGRTYPFHLSLQNPLYEPIQVRIMVQRPPATTSSASANTARTKRPPFVVQLPTSSFPIAPFAEAWEYDDEDEEDEEAEINEDDIEDMLAGRAHERSRTEAMKGGSESIGVIERKANVTKIGGEVVIGRDGTGPIKVRFPTCCLARHGRCTQLKVLAQFNLLVTYTYRADDAPDADDAATKGARAHVATKSFSYYVTVDLGTITPN